MEAKPEPVSTEEAQPTAEAASAGAPAHPTTSTPGFGVGVGFSETPSSREAGKAAARDALAAAGGGPVELALLFVTSKHDPAALVEGVRSVLGEDVPVVGGSAVGVITNDRLGIEGHQVGVAVLGRGALRTQLFRAEGLPGDERRVGLELGRQIASADFEGGPGLLLLYDIVKEQKAEGASLNMATPLLAGMGEGLDEAWPSTVGAGLLGDLHWNPTVQFVGDGIETQTAMAVAFHGGVHTDVTVLRGCAPSSGYHTITKSDGNVVLEVDGEPMADMIAKLMGQDSDEEMWAEYPIFITLGINRGEKFGEYNEDDYAVRLCMDVDRERRGLAFFGDDLVAGTEVQLMRRLSDVAYVEDRVVGLLDRIEAEGRRPRIAFYIDCAGRSPVMSGAERDEAEEVQKAVGDRVPLLGWYVGCEIARAGSSVDHHNWTGILCVLSE